MKRTQGLGSSRWTGRGFTLVELLVVIVIIGILAGLISTAVIAAMGKAREARVSMEIRNLEIALQTFKDRYGDFPPSRWDQATVEPFLRRAFPRYAFKHGANLYNQFKTDLQTNAGLTVDSMDAAAALAFWLGGIPDNTGKPRGFAKDPENPFRKYPDESIRHPPLYEFVQKRLVISGGTIRYYPDISGAIEAASPFVYFRASEYPNVSFRHIGGGEDVTITPYQNPTTGEYFNPQTFQIISAGRDNLYGGVNYEDNLTNFTEGKLKDALKK
ncbi:MAG: prepilin-type N-terminal cleavage/methylation domain-containing protein [Thermoguttaceae bacterium]|nr:prepilin-type N-terminal cleavage/methylation domain-containing protein [Thermoguttaceae bacterium]MDW8038686.1 prepilin-type N-terminal cleavage/methylation domain-containing protein [Thermoguttaceae bacterium]